VRTYRWATAGDINAFFGLMLDNLANLILTVGLLATAYNFPATFALRFMLPGTAIGVVVGDLVFTWMAFRLARRSGRNDITAMPLGLDTPSTIGMVLFVLGPAFSAATKAGLSPDMAARHTWQVGICAIVASGIFKLACAPASGWIRRTVPRAGLLGSLAAVALVLISFLPLVEMLHYPVVGFVSLGIILTTLVARVDLPWRLPGAAGALLVGGGIYYAMLSAGLLEAEKLQINPSDGLWPTGWLEVFQFGWVEALHDSVKYLPIVIPFALATVVGGIDCTESAAAAGDEYDTGRIIAVEGMATLVAGLCGGVIQTTPYIGHPAYKAMGGRAAYTLATALFIGSAGLLGYFGYLYAAIPRAAVFPILIFVGLEITAQSFQATPRRHYAAVAMACAPVLATLVMIFADQLLDAGQLDVTTLETAGWVPLARAIQTMRMLSGGFIITSLLWASALAMLVDRRLRAAAGFFSVGAVASLFGVIHSPLRGSPLSLPWHPLPPLPASAVGQAPLTIAASYAVLALLLAVWSLWVQPAKDV